MSDAPYTPFAEFLTGDLAAGIEVQVDIHINNSPDWSVVLANTGAAAITALAYQTSPHGTLFTPSINVTDGIPLAAGATLPIDGREEPVKILRLFLTSTVGASYAIEAGGT